jgi:asparagine synthase (glutamine-hydrolysing)
MCRIAGIISNSLAPEARKEIVKEMCTILRHGGPDDEGIYSNDEHLLTLGHRRLSIIDLSSAGHQPMSYNDGRYVITYNGEIYNYPELKSELITSGYTFKTNSDTEVILAAFAKWGSRSFSLLNGMFAFALWDNINSELYLVRDSVGMKPLYYAITSAGIAFASEIKAFKPIPYLQEVNEIWKVHMLAYGHLPEPITLLKHVRPLGAGSFIRYSTLTGQFDCDVYKQYSYLEKIEDRNYAIGRLRAKLKASIKRHLISDAPIGVFLSGGVDSSIIALLANDYAKGELHTLSLYPEEAELSEKKYQDIVQRNIQGYQKQDLLREKDFHEYLPTIFEAMDQPSCDGINTWFISKSAKDYGLKAVLSGLGADELFGGYPSFNRIYPALKLEYLPKRLLNGWKHSESKKMRRLSYLSLGGTIGKYLFLRGLFIPIEIAKQLDANESEVIDILKNLPALNNINHMDPRNQASWMEVNMYMRNQLLRDSDVMSMAHGIEIRIPFLDKEFIDLTLSLTSEIKYSGERKKQLLIDSFKDVIPETIWKRPKMGFTFPFYKWMMNSEYIKEKMTNSGQHNLDSYQQFTEGKIHWSQLMSLLLCQQ